MLLLCTSLVLIPCASLILQTIAGMLLDGLTVKDISGGGHGETNPLPKSKIGNTQKRKREEKEEEKEEDEKEEDPEAAKRVRRGGDGRERGRGARWRMGRHVENVSQ